MLAMKEMDLRAEVNIFCDLFLSTLFKICSLGEY